MVAKNHKHSMTQPERAFWRDVFVAALRLLSESEPADTMARAADFADAAVTEYRKRVTWRQQ